MATWSVGGWRNICTQRGLIEPINNVWRVTEIMGREKSQEKDWVFWGSIVKGVGFFLIYVLEEIRFSSLPQESEIEPTNIIVELGITTKLIICHILSFTFFELFLQDLSILACRNPGVFLWRSPCAPIAKCLIHKAHFILSSAHPWWLSAQGRGPWILFFFWNTDTLGPLITFASCAWGTFITFCKITTEVLWLHLVNKIHLPLFYWTKHWALWWKLSVFFSWPGPWIITPLKCRLTLNSWCFRQVLFKIQQLAAEERNQPHACPGNRTSSCG